MVLFLSGSFLFQKFLPWFCFVWKP